MSLRSKHRTLQKAEKQLSETVRSFLTSVPPKSTPRYAHEVYQQHNARWKDYCRKMQHKHKWLQMDASAFEQRVILINKQAERKLQPLKYYGRRAMLVALLVAIAGGIWLLTDVVLPYFGFYDLQLFKF